MMIWQKDLIVCTLMVTFLNAGHIVRIVNAGLHAISTFHVVIYPPAYLCSTLMKWLYPSSLRLYMPCGVDMIVTQCNYLSNIKILNGFASYRSHMN